MRRSRCSAREIIEEQFILPAHLRMRAIVGVVCTIIPEDDCMLMCLATFASSKLSDVDYPSLSSYHLFNPNDLPT